MRALTVIVAVLLFLFGLTTLLFMPLVDSNPFKTDSSQFRSHPAPVGQDGVQQPVQIAESLPTSDLDQYGAMVNITNMLQFEPHEVTIQAGQAVLWTNTSFDSHTVTCDPSLAANPDHVLLPDGAEPFNSKLIEPKKTYVKTFPIPGRYRYFCIPHEATGMVGEVIVTGTEASR